MSKLFDGVVGALLPAWTRLAGWCSWVDAHRLAAGPGNESSLYQNYDPEPVLSKFRYARENYWAAGSYGASQRVTSIHHNRSFNPGFTMQADRERALLNALREDIMLRLTMPGMTATAVHDQADAGFTYGYTSKNSIGSISVQAPTHRKTTRHYPVPTDLDDVEFTIALDETWTRPAIETPWWMKAVD